jgi:hypothetical protein
LVGSYDGDLCLEATEKGDRCPATHPFGGGVDKWTSELASNAMDGSTGLSKASVDVAA